MEKANIQVDFDKMEDMLSLFRKDSRAKFSFNIELPNGDIIVDFGSDGHIIGLEFFNASSYFPLLKNLVNQKINAKMSIQYGKEWAQIYYEISVPEKNIMLKQSIVSPYGKELIVAH